MIFALVRVREAGPSVVIYLMLGGSLEFSMSACHSQIEESEASHVNWAEVYMETRQYISPLVTL